MLQRRFITEVGKKCDKLLTDMYKSVVVSKEMIIFSYMVPGRLQEKV